MQYLYDYFYICDEILNYEHCTQQLGAKMKEEERDKIREKDAKETAEILETVSKANEQTGKVA